MSLLAVFSVVLLVVFLAGVVYWSCLAPLGLSSLPSETSAQWELSPEWLALSAWRREIESDPTLDEVLREQLKSTWRGMAEQTRTVSDGRSEFNHSTVIRTSTLWTRMRRHPGWHHALPALMVIAAAGLSYAIGGIHSQSLALFPGSPKIDLAQAHSGFKSSSASTERSPESGGGAHPGDAQPLDEKAKALASRLALQPDDLNGWVLLARTQSKLSRFQDSAYSLRRALALAPEHPDLMADLADMLAMANGRILQGEPKALVESALRMNPRHEKALALAATEAEQAGDSTRAQSYWARLSALQVEEQAQSQAFSSPPSQYENESQTQNPKATQNKAASSSSQLESAALLRVQVQLTELQIRSLRPESSLFVYIKLKSEAGMPLAVQKVPAKALRAGPNLVQITTTDVLPGQTLDQWPPTVFIQAKLSMQGKPKPSDQDVLSPWHSLSVQSLGANTSLALNLGQP